MADRPLPKPNSGLMSSLANVLGLLLPLAIFFLTTPFLLRGLGLAQFGGLTLFVAAVAVVGSLDLGLAASGVRVLGKSLQDVGWQQFRTVTGVWWTALSLLGAVYAAVLGFAGDALIAWAGLDVAEMHRAMLWTLPVSVFFAFFSMAASVVLRTLEAFVGLTLIQLVSGSLLWLGDVALVWWGGGLTEVLTWHAVLSGFSALLLMGWASHRAGRGLWRINFSFAEIRGAAAYSLHAFAAQLASNATYHADKFLVSHYLGAAAVGYYGLATNLSTKFLSLVSALSGFVFPRTVRMFEAGDLAGVRRVYALASRYTLLVSWPLLIVSLFLAEPFLVMWVGEAAARQSLPLVLMLLVAYFVASLSVVASHVFNGLGNARIGARFAVAGALLNVGACVLLIPNYGLSGAALASLLSMLQVFGYTFALHRRLDLPAWPFSALWLRIGGVALVQAGGLVLLREWVAGWPSLFIVVAIAWVGFYMIWFAFPLADDDDRRILGRILRGVAGRIVR